MTWKDTVSTDTVVIANGTELFRRVLTYMPIEYTYHRELGIEIPNESLNWCTIDQLRALYNVLTGSNHTCQTPTDYTMYNVTLDVQFSNNTKYHITLSHIQPTSIREAQGSESYYIDVYGYGFIESYQNRLG